MAEVPFNALLLLEPLHAEYLAVREADVAMGTALRANPAVSWYLAQIYPPIQAYINRCLALVRPNPSQHQIREAERAVLDVGSGTGRLAFTVAPLAAAVYAIEPVANLRRYLWQKRERLGQENVYPLDGRITHIPLADNFADILMAGHVFGEYVEKEYNEMRRVVRPGGMILLHPGTNAGDEDEAHHFLVGQGFAFDTFEEPGDGPKRKYWKTIQK